MGVWPEGKGQRLPAYDITAPERADLSVGKTSHPVREFMYLGEGVCILPFFLHAYNLDLSLLKL